MNPPSPPTSTHPALLLIDVASQVLHTPRQPEVGDLADFVVIDEDVTGSQVSVYYLAGREHVRTVEGEVTNLWLE